MNDKNYNNYTNHVMEIGKSFNFKPIDIDDVLYTFPEIIYKFRTAITNPAICNIFLGGGKYGDPRFPGMGFCGIVSYSLKILFPQLDIDSTADMSHVWTTYQATILDATGDQFILEQDLKNAYQESPKKKAALFKRSKDYVDARQHNMLFGDANMFISYVFGWKEMG
ncbi:MAG: hypothetical protein LBF37_03410 [Rickettsiales bacterium]|jgi:hypothetical protein|nr:hypothetical protein [Rickettsiales bacterium]